jgi:flagellar basal-body rod protein FlgB
MKALAIAATGMNAQSTNVDVIANNIANINTTGFKRSRAEFTDLLYETQRLAGVANRGNQGVVPEGAQIIPTNATQVNVSQSGAVTATVANSTTPLALGQLTLATFANPVGLLALGSNLFQETAASGTPVIGVPGDPGFATISQGYLEASNVDPVSEITNLISAQRAYEMNSKIITAADQMSQTISKNMG